MKKKSGTSMYDDEMLNTILAVFEEMINILKENKNNVSLFYDSADVKRLLNISDSTLFPIRKSQDIPYVKIGRKNFYPKSFFIKTLKK